MSTATATFNDYIEPAYATDLHGFLHQKYDRTIYFSSAGWARYLSVVGLCQGLALSDPDKARVLMRSLDNRIGYLVSRETIDVPCCLNDGTEHVSKVPASKLVINDDGCLNSFSFGLYRPVEPDKYLELETAYKASTGRTKYLNRECRDEFEATLNIRHKIADREITECLPGFTRVRYRFAYNGGIVFHGELNDLPVDDSPENSPWGIHT